MVKNAATWSSFSGSVSNLNKNMISIPSIKGFRYFGPSKMSFFKLLIHSFSIIAVFRKTVFLRTFIFLLVYLFLVFQSLSLITSLPILLVLILLIAVFLLSGRENLKQFNSSLDNILNIDNLS